jgi:hypothetical protein
MAVEGHSHPKEHKERDKSGQESKVKKQGVLTAWRTKIEQQLRTLDKDENTAVERALTL